MQISSISSHSWKDEYKAALKSTKELASFLEVPLPSQPFSIFMPQAFAKKVKDSGENSPLWKQFVPSFEENNLAGLHDPIGDKAHAKDNGIIHRYKNRVLYSPTTICPIHCRYCFRKNELNQQDDFLKASLPKLVDYLLKNPCVEEVILTGGDPLILSNEKIDQILKAISKISSIKYIRFHTRTPIVIPNRIDHGLIELIKKYKNIFETITFAIHVNHLTELDDNVILAVKNLADININLLSQTVLLKDINDNPQDLIDLFKAINRIGVKPYYLHHPDQVLGAMHFYLPLRKGREIYAKLRNELPGWLIPHYMLDSPLGSGKSLAFNPETYEFSGKLIDRFGSKVKHVEPT